MGQTQRLPLGKPSVPTQPPLVAQPPILLCHHLPWGQSWGSTQGCWGSTHSKLLPATHSPRTTPYSSLPSHGDTQLHTPAPSLPQPSLSLHISYFTAEPYNFQAFQRLSTHP